MNTKKIITEDFINVPLGLYKIFWKSGGTSLAAIGNLYDGIRWVAPINWTCENGANPTGIMNELLDDIKKLEIIKE